MKKIRNVTIENFWGDKRVNLNFNKDINFLIGVNGSGKTTIINLIAASLNADFSTLDKAQFSKIRISFFAENEEEKGDTYIEIQKKEKIDSPYANINIIIKLKPDAKAKTFKLNEIEEEIFYRYPKEYIRQRNFLGGGQFVKDVNLILQSNINLTWLSIHRANRNNLHSDDKSFDSSIDQKIKELSTELVKYFGVLDKKYSAETEKFQKNIFLSLIEGQKNDKLLITEDLDSIKEKESLRQIFLLFKLQEAEFSSKLDRHFKGFDQAKKILEEKKSIQLESYHIFWELVEFIQLFRNGLILTRRRMI